MDVFSIGYEKKSIQVLCRLLAEAGVERLVDVRAAAWSQRPQFRREALRLALAAHGIEYVHCKAAGNPFRPKAGELFDVIACRADFARHVEEHPEVMRELTPHLLDKPAALFCYESTRHRCHRGVLLDVLAAQMPGVQVVDLGAEPQESLLGAAAS